MSAGRKAPPDAPAPVNGRHAVASDSADQALDALASRRLASEGGRRASRLQTLLALQRAGLAVVGHLTPERICAALIAELESLLPYERGLVAVLDQASGEIEVLAHAGRDIDESKAERERIARIIRDNPRSGVIRWVIENGQPLRIGDTAAEDRYLVGASRMRSELCVPIVHSGRVLGAINVESERPGAFGQVDEVILSAVASPVAVALENAKLYQELERELAVRQRAETALAESELRYRALVENAEEGILVALRDGIDFCNRSAEKLLASSGADLRNRPLRSVIHPRSHAEVEHSLAAVLGTGEPARLRAVQLATAGERWVDVTLSRIEWNGARAALCFLSDVTEPLRLTRQLGHLASHDHLTGLVNRREFESRLAGALKGATAPGVEHVMCFMDLDQFKAINDTCGHQAGDELLARLSTKMSAVLRSRDTLARLGGDEFGVLLEHCGIDQAMRVAAKLEQVVREFRMVWDGREYAIGASIGLAAVGPEHASVTDVLRAADSACYVAKEEGRGRIRVYRDDDESLSRRSAGFAWLARVRSALQHDRIVLYCQPIVALDADMRAERYEILMRLQEPDGTIVSPGAFLPAVERYDLAAALDRHVVEKVLAWLRRNPARLARMDCCSINLSARSLGDRTLLDAIAGAISGSGVPAGKLCFEVTETGAIRDTHASIGFMRTLADLGCSFALDDFGAGLSSFGYLRDLPVEIIKIDGSFVSRLPQDHTSTALISAMQSLARTLGMKTVAEFASSDAIVQALRRIGVDFVQGYAICEPFPLDRLADQSPDAS